MDEIEERETVLLKILKNKGTGHHQHISAALPGGSVVKSPPANAGDVSLIPGLEDPLEEKMVTHSSILVWRIPWTEKPGRLSS